VRQLKKRRDMKLYDDGVKLADLSGLEFYSSDRFSMGGNFWGASAHRDQYFTVYCRGGTKCRYNPVVNRPSPGFGIGGMMMLALKVRGLEPARFAQTVVVPERQGMVVKRGDRTGDLYTLDLTLAEPSEEFPNGAVEYAKAVADIRWVKDVRLMTGRSLIIDCLVDSAEAGDRKEVLDEFDKHYHHVRDIEVDTDMFALGQSGREITVMENLRPLF
jgi:hypothetical protein